MVQNLTCELSAQPPNNMTWPAGSVSLFLFQLTLLRQLIAGSFRSDRKFFVEGIDAGSPA
jgi:hypothetical protein